LITVSKIVQIFSAKVGPVWAVAGCPFQYDTAVNSNLADG